jgi:hypothetical protein
MLVAHSVGELDMIGRQIKAVWRDRVELEEGSRGLVRIRGLIARKEQRAAWDVAEDHGRNAKVLTIRVKQHASRRRNTS